MHAGTMILHAFTVGGVKCEAGLQDKDSEPGVTTDRCVICDIKRGLKQEMTIIAKANYYNVQCHFDDVSCGQHQQSVQHFGEVNITTNIGWVTFNSLFPV